jgi:hypothetical protein
MFARQQYAHSKIFCQAVVVEHADTQLLMAGTIISRLSQIFVVSLTEANGLECKEVQIDEAVMVVLSLGRQVRTSPHFLRG